MSEEEIIALLECLKPKVARFEKNETINSAGDTFEGVGVVLEGQAAVVKENASGNRVIIAVLKQGDIFGEMAAFSGNGKWPATVIAQTDCSIMYVPPDKILGQCEKTCTSHRTLIMNMLRILSDKALTLGRKLEYLTMKSVRGKIAKYLIECYKKTGHATLFLPLNRNELADFLNITRPSLSRELCIMRDEGLIDFHRSSVRLKNIKELEKAAE